MDSVKLKTELNILGNLLKSLHSELGNSETPENLKLRWELALLSQTLKQRSESSGASKLVFCRLEYRGLTVEGEFTQMNLRDDQKVSVSAQPRDAKGVATGITPGTAVWSSSDDTIASVSVDPANELAATIVGGTPPPADADGNPGPAAVIQLAATDTDGEPLVGQVAINVVAADAETVELVLGTPEAQ